MKSLERMTKKELVEALAEMTELCRDAEARAVSAEAELAALR